MSSLHFYILRQKTMKKQNHLVAASLTRTSASCVFTFIVYLPLKFPGTHGSSHNSSDPSRQSNPSPAQMLAIFCQQNNMMVWKQRSVMNIIFYFTLTHCFMSAHFIEPCTHAHCSHLSSSESSMQSDFPSHTNCSFMHLALLHFQKDGGQRNDSFSQSKKTKASWNKH